MGIAQEQFDRAVTDYKKAIFYLDEIGDILSEVKNDFSSNTLKAQFDIILQFTLFKTAIGDSDFRRVENQFIEKITGYGDLLAWLNNKCDTNFEWDNFLCMPEHTISEFIDAASQAATKLTAEFLASVSLAEILKNFNYSEAIIRQVNRICTAFTYVDGDGENKQEDAAMFAAIEHYFEKPLAFGRSQAKEALASMRGKNNQSSAMGTRENTLAANYERLKKSNTSRK